MISLDSIMWVGEDLHRPECVLATKAGNVYSSNWRGGVTQIGSDGSQCAILATDTDLDVKPNGIALDYDDTFLLAHLGEEEGGVFRLYREGTLEPELTQIYNQILPPTNFVHLDDQHRMWISVSTHLCPRADAYRSNHADGFIILKDGHGEKIVAEELGYTNECVVHPSGKWLYTNETFARRLSRFTIQPNGDLTNQETVTEFGEGVFPDGLTFMEDGSVWITSIVSNRIIRIGEDGKQTVMLEDADPEHLKWVEEAYQNHEMSRTHLDQNPSKSLRNISSLAFGGHDLSTAYVGCLLGTQIASFPSPVKGIAPSHWLYDE